MKLEDILFGRIVMKLEDILFIGINIAIVILGISYKILYSMGLMALQYAEIAAPMEESGIYVFLTFGEIFFVVGFSIVLLLDILVLCNAADEYQKEKNKGWL